MSDQPSNRTTTTALSSPESTIHDKTEQPFWKNRFYVELLIILIGSVIVVYFAGQYDALEEIIEWSEEYEDYEIDEILTLTFVLSIALSIFSWRRVTDTRREMKKRSEAEHQMRHMAMHDSMTGLPNRAMFLERLSQELERAKRTSEFVALFALDIDCSGLIELDTLMRDNNCQSVRCHHESKTKLQAIPERV